MRIAQHQVLRNKLNVGDAAFIRFDIKTIAMLIAQMGPHFLTHFAHIGLQGFRIADEGHDIATNRIKLRGQPRVAVHHSSAHQRLMLPRPSFVALVISESLG